MQKGSFPDSVKKIVNEFTELLKAAYGGNLISVILYGSAASGEYATRHSNLNMAAVLKDASMYNLNKIKPIINKRKFMIINPVFFSEDYIRHSTDVFPIEFIDMKENHVVIYGKDVLSDMEIDLKNLRFQCEQELKSKIINIKRLYLRIDNTILLRELLFKSVTSAIHILRFLLRLKGKTPPYAKEDVLNELEREFALDMSAMRKILDARKNNLSLSKQEIDDSFSDLVKVLEAAADKADHF